MALWFSAIALTTGSSRTTGSSAGLNGLAGEPMGAYASNIIPVIILCVCACVCVFACESEQV